MAGCQSAIGTGENPRDAPGFKSVVRDFSQEVS